MPLLPGDAGGEFAFQHVVAGGAGQAAFEQVFARDFIDQNKVGFQAHLFARGGGALGDIKVAAPDFQVIDFQDIRRIDGPPIAVKAVDEGVAQILAFPVGDAVDSDVLQEVFVAVIRAAVLAV